MSSPPLLFDARPHCIVQELDYVHNLPLQWARISYEGIFPFQVMLSRDEGEA